MKSQRRSAQARVFPRPPRDTSTIAVGPSPWMTSAEGADYVRKPTPAAFRVWAMRRGIVPVHAGRKCLYARADVAAAIRKAERRQLAEAV